MNEDENVSSAPQRPAPGASREAWVRYAEHLEARIPELEEAFTAVVLDRQARIAELEQREREDIAEGNDALVDEVDQLEDALGRAKARIADLEAYIEPLEARYADLTACNKHLEARVAELEACIAELEVGLDHWRGAALQARNSRDAAGARIAELEAEVWHLWRLI